MDEPPAVRIGDAEREQFIDALRRATAEGRLTLDEFAERSGAVYAARGRDELDRQVADLPHDARPPSTAVAPSTGHAREPASRESPGATASGKRRRRFVAVMSGSAPRGRWRVADEVTAFAFWGAVKLDLREALIDAPVVEITAWSVMGGVDVVVPAGIPVELEGCVVMGGSHDLTRGGAPIDGAPLVRVKARGLWGAVAVRTGRSPEQRAEERARRAEDRAARRARREEDSGTRSHGHHRRHGGLHPAPSATGGAEERARRTMRSAEERAERAQDRAEWVMDRAEDGIGRVGARLRSPQLPGPRLDDVPPPMPGRRPAEAARPDVRAEPGGAAAGPRHHADARPSTDDAAAPDVGRAAGSGARPGPVTGDVPDAGPSAVPGAPSGQVLTILVSDICGSTALAERLGDQRWIGVLQAHDALVRAQVTRHGGTEVKSLGDGFLVTFTSARQAVLAGVGIQRALARHRQAYPESALHVRIGVHSGEVTVEDGDVVGQNVTIAVRAADVATPDEVLATGLTHDLTAASGDLRYEAGRDVDLKGVSQSWRVHTVSPE